MTPTGSAVSLSRVGVPDDRALGFSSGAIFRRRCVKMRGP
ncbi:hypothetical protein SZ54_2002 [Rhizobium sp. UR51a]|nr:hypothetical protein SZ54_2002 [Rhizobium sp. UR51a]